MSLSKIGLTALAVVVAAAPASAENWTAVGASDGHGERLSLAVDPARSYIFECAPEAVVITETGVTDLLDVRTGTKVGDGPGSTMSPGASVMALFTGKGSPDFVPATAVANPAKGWDMTIRLAKSDKQLNALAKTDMLSLFTTGFTAAVSLSVADRKLFGDFLARCRA